MYYTDVAYCTHYACTKVKRYYYYFKNKVFDFLLNICFISL